MKGKQPITVNVMAPLLVGDPHDMDSDASQSAWAEFDRHLRLMKKLGIKAVSTDVWWGLIYDPSGNYRWDYYDRIVEHIVDAGLKWMPILSFHQCGGNVGDDVFVPIPQSVWSRLITLAKARGLFKSIVGLTERDFKYVSEQGHECDEYISVWATALALELFEETMLAFRSHFADRAEHIAEINISLGPAGELRYPSYNSHDNDTDYPTRGALQCYSRLAIRSFEQWALKKYGTHEGIDAAWGTSTAKGQKVQPPTNVAEFFGRSDHRKIQYGRDFFDWYAQSLREHGRTVLRKALAIFSAADSPMKGIDIGAKVPGIHWRTGKKQGNKVILGDRLAELAAGLIQTSGDDWDSDDRGRGYRPLMKLFKDLQGGENRLVLHFTCLEMPDGEGAERNANSVARSLVNWVGREAQHQAVPIKGENAVAWNLPIRASWQRMTEHLALPGSPGFYHGLTILRMSDIAEGEVAREETQKMVEKIQLSFSTDTESSTSTEEDASDETSTGSAPKEGAKVEELHTDSGDDQAA